MEPIIGTLILAVLAGITWTCGGYAVDYRKNHSNPEWEGFDKKKLRNDIILGFCLGLIVIIVQPLFAGTDAEYALPTLEKLSDVAVGVVALLGPVTLIDKFIIGGLAGKVKA